MTVMRYSRIIVLLSASIACVAINFGLIMTGHYRAPLFVFLACILVVATVLPKLPPFTKDPQQIRTSQLKASRSFRQVGYIFIGGFVLGLLNLLSGEFKGIPAWWVVIMFCWSGFLIWGCFRMAKRYRTGNPKSEDVPGHTNG
jgi:RsiW-degrading membrane proteinase PrsW (M82 family)